jgi:hypothetical protein
MGYRMSFARSAVFLNRFRQMASRLVGVLGMVAVAQAPLSGQSVLYVGSANSQQITAYDLNTQQVYGAGSALATTFFGFGPSVATDPSGNVYVSFNGGGIDWIKKFDSSGALVTSFGTGGTVQVFVNTLLGTARVNPSGTQLLQPFNANANEIRAFDTSTGASPGGFTTVSLINPTGLAFNPSGTFFYASRPSGALQGTTITQYSTSGGVGTQLTFTGGGFSNNGFDDAKGLYFQSDTSMIVVSTSLVQVERYTLSGTSATLDTTFGVNGGTNINFLTGGITADSSGNLYLTTSNGIAQISANGTLLNGAFITDANSPKQIAIGLSAIPEPTNVAILSGLIALGGAWRFRRRA